MTNKALLIIHLYRLIVIISVLIFSHFEGYGFLWLLLLVGTSFAIGEDE